MNTHIRGTFTQRHAPTQTHTHTHMITTASTVNQMSALSVNIGLSSGAYYLSSDMVVSFIIQHTMIICVTNIKCEVCNVYLHWYQVWWQLLIPVKAGILFYRYSKYWQQPAGIESKLSVSSWQWWDLFFCLLGQYLPQSFYHSAWANLTSRLLYSLMWTMVSRPFPQSPPPSPSSRNTSSISMSFGVNGIFPALTVRLRLQEPLAVPCSCQICNIHVRAFFLFFYFIFFTDGLH